MESIGYMLKSYRKERRLTQKELSHDICSQSVLSRIENDEEIPNIVVTEQLCQRLGIKVDQLLAKQTQEEVVMQKYFHKLFLYLRQERFKELNELINYLDHRVYLVGDKQQFYYFKAVASFHLLAESKTALALAQQGLKLELDKCQPGCSEIRVLLLALAGKAAEQLTEESLAEMYYQKAFQLFRTLVVEYSERVEITSLFVDYGWFLLRHNRPEEATQVVKRGISWNKQLKSYYKLQELFLLQQKILTIYAHQVVAKPSKLPSEIQQLENL